MLERRCPGQQMVKSGAETVDVAGTVFPSGGDFFRTDIERAAVGILRLLFLGLIADGDPEISDLGIAVRIQHDIAGLDIVVDNAVIGGVFEAFGGIVDPLDDIIDREGGAFGQQQLLFQRTAGHELHDDVGLPLIDAAGINGDHAGVVDGCRRAGFVQEPFLSARSFGIHDLHRHFAVQRDIQRAVDRRHAAPSAGFLQQI